MNQQLSPESSFLLVALKGLQPEASTSLTAQAERVRDWRRMSEQCARHGIGPWLLATLRLNPNIRVPPDVLATLRIQALELAMRQLELAHALEGVLHTLCASAVPVIVLKGPHVAERLYPEAGLRPYQDLDIMVDPRNATAAATACEALGFVRDAHHGPKMHPRHGTDEMQYEELFIHRATGVRLDLHYDQMQLGLRPRSLEAFWQRCEPWPFLSTHALCPSNGDLLLLLAVHLHRHGFDRMIWLKDIDLLVRKGDIDWEWLQHEASLEGIEASVRQCLWMAERYLDTPIPSAIRRWARKGALYQRLLWRRGDPLQADVPRFRWRRAVQFVPQDGPRGALPSLLVMGRRKDKLRSLRQRIARPGREIS